MGRGTEGSHDPGGPPKSTEGPPSQGDPPPSLLPEWCPFPPRSTHWSLFTTPLPLGSNRRKALRMASSGSVPGRPREPVSIHTASVQPPPRRSPGGGVSAPPREAGRVQSSGRPGSARLWRWAGLAGRPGLGTWEWRLKAYFPTSRLGVTSAQGSGMQGWAPPPLGQQGPGGVWMGSGWKSGQVQVGFELAAQPGGPDLPQAHR